MNEIEFHERNIADCKRTIEYIRNRIESDQAMKVILEKKLGEYRVELERVRALETLQP